MSTIGIPVDQLRDRNKTSLIKYIGALQTELAALYDQRFQEHRRGIKDSLANQGRGELKCTN